MRFWKKLLIEQRDQGKSGLSIPFLIGSQKFLTENVNPIGIDDLLIECVTNSSFETCLRYCLHIKTLILEIRKPITPVVYPTYKEHAQIGLSISTFNNNLGYTIEEITKTLTESFEKKICNELYSVQLNDYGRDSIWTDFNGSDIEFITRVFSKK